MSKKIKVVILVGAAIAIAGGLAFAIWHVIESIEDQPAKLHKYKVVALPQVGKVSDSLDITNDMLHDRPITDAHAKDPNVAKFGKAKERFNDGKFEEALAEFREVRQNILARKIDLNVDSTAGSTFSISPSDSAYLRQTYLSAAQCLYELNNMGGAIEELSQGIARYPKDISFYLNRAEAYKKSGKVELAENDIAVAKKLHLKSKLADEASAAIEHERAKSNEIFTRAFRFEQTGAYDDALRLYRQAKELRQKAARMADQETAKQDSTEASDADAPHGSQRAGQQSGELPIQSGKQLATPDLPTATCCSRICVVYFVQKKYDDALTSINEAIKICPVIPGFYEKRSAVYRAMNKPELAERDAQTLAKLSGNKYTIRR